MTHEHLTQARGFFERTLALDPGSVEALVGTAIVDYSMGTNFFTDERAASIAAAETALNKALSMAPQHAQAHMYLGVVYIFTFRAAQGIAECERALALDRNLANAHGWIGRGKFHLGRAEETEAHIHEALRPLTSRHLCLPVDDGHGHRQVLARCRCRSGRVVAA